MAQDLDISTDTTLITQWRSIVTLIVFVLTNLAVLFPFHLPIFVPSVLVIWTKRTLIWIRVIPRSYSINEAKYANFFIKLLFPVNFMTAPLVADLFLLAILAIGRDEVSGGTIGANNINPIDIMAFFLTLAYIAISIDASGLIRYLAFKVLTWGGKVGHRLFFFLYAFFFSLGTFIGNDPIILSGTAFLAYMTRVSSNIEHPRAWIHTQFAVANIASAILVSSNPTNLVLAGAFDIKFVDYTANMIVPVVITAIVTFPFLLYIIFAHEKLIPIEITMHSLPEEYKGRAPVNPNIPNARGEVADWNSQNGSNEAGKLQSLEEIMNPFIDKSGAIIGASIMTATLVAVLVLNGASQSTGEHPVFYVTLPAAFVMFCWDVTSNWIGRHKTRQIAQDGRREIKEARRRQQEEQTYSESTALETSNRESRTSVVFTEDIIRDEKTRNEVVDSIALREMSSTAESQDLTQSNPDNGTAVVINNDQAATTPRKDHGMHLGRDTEPGLDGGAPGHPHEPRSLVSMAQELYLWCQETFPTVTAVLEHLPFALIPFAFCMFVLVEALVTKGWVPVFAYGWDHWVSKTGTVGAVGGMAFLSVILCNFAGTNIGTTILLSRVIQTWVKIHEQPGDPLPSNRDYWATIYAMALGVNYGAFSTAFSASLAGLLWRDILARKHIHVGRAEFARVNLPIIAVAMVVGCSVLLGEVYIMRRDDVKWGHLAT